MNADNARQFVQTIIAMRNDARDRLRYWQLQPPNNDTDRKIDYYTGIRAEHNILLTRAAELGIVPDGMDLWAGE